MICATSKLWALARMKPGDRVAIVANIPDLIEANNWWGWRCWAPNLAPGSQGEIVDVFHGRMLVKLDSAPEQRFMMRTEWLGVLPRPEVGDTARIIRGEGT